ncbi:MAG TPA: lysophospholipid acyltransferase family protein [Polyangia bacterium]|nr:lysophospholipid acyltransferase family protein [Polyangia bacterium]
MIRALVSLITFLISTIIGSIVSLIFGLVDRTGGLVLELCRVWSAIVLGVPGVKVEIEVRGRIDPHKPYVFMANHASMVDIWAMFLRMPVPVRFIAKKQLGQIPVFGWAMRAGRFVFIDRQNAASARRSIQEAAQRIKDGQSVAIFPEGTRTRDGKLGAFKKGGFHLAIDAGVEIVPLAIRGTRAVMPPGTPLIRAGRVQIEVDEPISTAGLGPSDRQQLLDRVYARIAAMLGEPTVRGEGGMAPQSAASP